MCEAAEKEEKDDPIHYPPPPPVLIGRQPTSLFNCHHLPPLPPPPPPPAAQEQSPISFPLSLFLSHTKRRESFFRRSHLFLLRYFFSRLDLVIEKPFLTLSSLKKPERRGELGNAVTPPDQDKLKSKYLLFFVAERISRRQSYHAIPSRLPVSFPSPGFLNHHKGKRTERDGTGGKGRK